MPKKFRPMSKAEADIVSALLAGAIVQVYGEDCAGTPTHYEVRRQGVNTPVERKAVEQLWGTLALKRTVYRRRTSKHYYALHPTLREALVNLSIEATSVLIELSDGWTLVATRIAGKPGTRYTLVKGRETKPVRGQVPHSLIARSLVFMERESNGTRFYRLSNFGHNAAAYIAA